MSRRAAPLAVAVFVVCGAGGWPRGPIRLAGPTLRSPALAPGGTHPPGGGAAAKA
jgi:hypothetical protein